MDTQPERVDGQATDNEGSSARREFLRKARKFAAVTPPLIATMLSVTSTPARANGSGSSSRPGNGYGDKNHDHSGPPGRNK